MKWISVEDRLPENEQTVLIYSPIYKTTLMATFEIDDGYFDDELPCTSPDSEPAHWMPLPDPPD